MATVKLKGNPAETSGNLPRPGSAAPAFELAKSDLSNARLAAIALMYIYGHGSEMLGGRTLKPTKSRRTNLANLMEVLSWQEEK